MVKSNKMDVSPAIQRRLSPEVNIEKIDEVLAVCLMVTAQFLTRKK